MPKLSLYGLRRRWPVIVAVIIGIAAAFFATTQLQTYMNTHVETTRMPVPVRNIAPYVEITTEDIGWRNVVKGGEEPGAIKDPAEAVGKISLSTLYKNEQVKKERLADASLIKDKQIVSVNVDVARSVGGWLQAGDTVDVWWIQDGSISPGSWIKVAANAVVLDLRDSAGRSLLVKGGVLQQSVGEVAGNTTPPAVAVLAVSSSDVSRVIGGASPKSQNIVLSKKFSETKEPVLPVQPVPETEKKEGDNIVQSDKQTGNQAQGKDR